MQNSTLFLIQAPFSQMDKTWQELSDMANADDSIVIMGDAILQINPACFNHVGVEISVIQWMISAIKHMTNQLQSDIFSECDVLEQLHPTMFNAGV